MKHLCVKSQLEFKVILFVPKRDSFNVFDTRNKLKTIKLYVIRLFIMENYKEFIPENLGFVKGVVDSDDFPLDIYRKILQQNFF